MNKEKIKKEFRETFTFSIVNSENIIDFKNSVADWWLSKIKDRDLALYKEVEEYDRERIARYWENHDNKKSSNEVVIDILQIIKNKIV